MNRTEAKKFITKVVTEWDSSELPEDNKKVISLAEFAQRWYNPDGGPMAKAEAMKKDINSLKALIRRGTEAGKNVSLYEGALKTSQKEFDDFVAEHKIVFKEKKKKVKE
jgi:hypothetical protein